MIFTNKHNHLCTSMKSVVKKEQIIHNHLYNKKETSQMNVSYYFFKI